MRGKDILLERKKIQSSENKGTCYISGVLGSRVVPSSVGWKCTLGLWGFLSEIVKIYGCPFLDA